MSFDKLPDEVVSSILSLLAPEQLIPVQLVSNRFARLARDNTLWKEICFEFSRFETARRRQELLNAQESQLAQLREAVQRIPGAFPTATGSMSSSSSHQILYSSQERRARALVNWDPTYPSETTDFYQEYVQRHGRICVDWLEEPWSKETRLTPEAMGIGTLRDSDGIVNRVVSPFEDGSLCMWELNPDNEPHRQGRILARSAAGVLSLQPGPNGRPASIANETGAIENVSVDSHQQRAYFAIHDNICEIDLHTLQLTRRDHFSFPVSCLSQVDPFTAITVGTTQTLHLFDPRAPSISASTAPPNVSQIAGTNTSLHSTLSQPGPLSILHHPLPSSSHELWVAGRFKSILSYDRRFWPRVHQTLFSGAHLSSLSSITYPSPSRNLDLTQNPTVTVGQRLAAKSAPGATLLAAGEYRGKGSLEFYTLSPDDAQPDSSIVSPTARFQNRTNASRTRLLSIAPHGTRYIVADADGMLKWFERDAWTLVRELNINDYVRPRREDRVSAKRPSAEIRTVYHGRDSGIGTPMSVSSDESEGEASALFAEGENGDIVQRVIPTHSPLNDLLVWTADGRLGVVGFGNGRGDGFGDATCGRAMPGASSDEDDESEQRREREEQLFGMRMRRALERQADEARFVRGLGMGGRWG